MGELLLKHADNLSRTLQHKSLSAADSERVASMIVETLKGIRGDEELDLLQTKETSKAGAIDVGEPALLRRRRAPMRFDDRLVEKGKRLHGNSEGSPSLGIL